MLIRMVQSSTNQNRNKIENLISELERCGISDRAGATLLNAHNRYLGMITYGKDKDAVDKFKIRKARSSYRLKLKNKMQPSKSSYIPIFSYIGHKSSYNPI